MQASPVSDEVPSSGSGKAEDSGKNFSSEAEEAKYGQLSVAMALTFGAGSAGAGGANPEISDKDLVN